MDKSWIDLRESNPRAYFDGVKMFLDFAYEDKNPNASIYCPCNKCANRYYRKREVVNNHLALDGFLRSYKTWSKHGERLGNTSSASDSMETDDSLRVEHDVAANMINMVQEGLGIPHVEGNMGNDQNAQENVIGPDEYTAKILKLLKEAEEEVYPGCKNFTKLSFIVELMNIKVLNGITNNGITMILKFMKKVWPDSNIPKSYYHANKMTTDLGFTYETWDACINHCMIFRKEDVGLEKCSECHAPRYKENDSVSNGITTGNDVCAKVKKKARKKVRYFPLKTRLQRLFWSSKTAPLMRWHAEQRIDDGIMRHPADSLAWKSFDQKNPGFANDSRNPRLAIACDGFNPFGNLSIAHSTWPVIVIPYNLPPWLCMRQPNFIVSMIIDGDKAPGNKIDVFLKPLVEELKELWEDGILTYDISRNEMFKLHAGLLWTINDFPAYGDMSGWVTKGEFACPSCNIDPVSLWLKHSGKWSYPNNRRFLKRNHRFRKDRVSFIQQKVEVKTRPLVLSGEQLVQQLKDIGMETVYKKGDLSRKRKREGLEKQAKAKRTHNWKKFSIFYELPYWEHYTSKGNRDKGTSNSKGKRSNHYTSASERGNQGRMMHGNRDRSASNSRGEFSNHQSGSNQLSGSGQQSRRSVSSQPSGSNQRTGSGHQSRTNQRTGARTDNKSTIRREYSATSEPSSESHMQDDHTLEGDSNEKGSTSKKKGRGPAKPNADWGVTGKKLILEWNEFDEPVGPNAKILAAQLGNYGRDSSLLPLTITSWSGQDPDVLDSIWQDVLENTNAPAGYKDVCLDIIHDRWKTAKHNVKLHYLAFESDEERRENCPEHVDPDEWEILIKYWGKESVQAQAKINAECRGCPMAVPRKGRTSFANMRYEMENNNEPTDRVSTWKKSRMKKDGTFDEKDGAKEIAEQLTAKLSKLTSEEAQNEARVDQVFVDVVGEDGHGRIRTMGPGMARHMKRAKKTVHPPSKIARICTEHEEQKEKINMLEKKLHEQEEIVAKQQAIVAEVMMMIKSGQMVVLSQDKGAENNHNSGVAGHRPSAADGTHSQANEGRRMTTEDDGVSEEILDGNEANGAGD